MTSMEIAEGASESDTPMEDPAPPKEDEAAGKLVEYSNKTRGVTIAGDSSDVVAQQDSRG